MLGEVFNGLASKIGFLEPMPFKIGNQIGRLRFGFEKLSGIRITGMDLLENWGIMADLPTHVLHITRVPAQTCDINQPLLCCIETGGVSASAGLGGKGMRDGGTGGLGKQQAAVHSDQC